ncbi:MAG: glycosyltransferase family 9 protein [Flavobacteriales bacterium]|nr:glycosyltransferase family 9 protein [Flavobacteriales bacterium]MBP9078887.1 glycosyltransferase family 9 protein [Flavobacteriales bacterium]
MSTPGTILLSRTDSIGDVVLSLPMATWLKQRYPAVRIVFLCKRYTAPVVRCHGAVDDVLELETLLAAPEGPVETLRALHADAVVHVFPQRTVARWAKTAGIPRRIGTSHRWWHWATCNERVALGRRRSDLHEAQLNMKLLAPLGLEAVPPLDAMGRWPHWNAPRPDARVQNLLNDPRRTVLLHPGSRGSAVEWGIGNHVALARSLDPTRYRVLFTGTEAEGRTFRPALPDALEHVQDISGLLPLEQLIALIARSHALVAASTGPLHIAAASGIRAIGLYAPRKPIHPGRWAPLGRDAHALVHDAGCTRCAAGKPCNCITRIAPGRVSALIDR